MIRAMKLAGVVVLLLLPAVNIQAEEAKGSIKSVDAGRKEVVLKGTLKDTAYDVASDAGIWLDGRRCKLDDLKIDDRVVVTYEKQANRLTARKVRALRNMEEAVGKVRETFADKRELIIKGTVKDTTYELTKDATLWIGGKKAALTDLRQGDEVLITYERRGDHLMANDVSVTSR
jgi:Cu/Ag efflux protein CusF